jgi:hypothetical protein
MSVAGVWCGYRNNPLVQGQRKAIRKAALQFNVPCVTTITGAEALVEAISTKMSHKNVTVRSLQEIHESHIHVAAESKV